MRSRLRAGQLSNIIDPEIRNHHQSKQFVRKTPAWAVIISSEARSHVVQPNRSKSRWTLSIRLKQGLVRDIRDELTDVIT